LLTLRACGAVFCDIKPEFTGNVFNSLDIESKELNFTKSETSMTDDMYANESPYAVPQIAMKAAKKSSDKSDS